MTEQPLGSTYTLTERLGAGAMGVVHRGRDTSGHEYAFKVLRPEFSEDPALVQRFVQERSSLTGVDHPNVVRMHDLVIEGSTLAIVMDLVPGGDLRQELGARGNLPPAEVARLGGQIASGLAAVHAAGLVHRDVKPENVLLDRSGDQVVPRVSDFGIARLADATAATRSTMMLGTPNYVAPEIAEGRSPSGAADVYSLGIVLYELATGVTPFEGGSHLAVIRRHADAPAPRPQGLPDDLWAAIRDMVSKHPDERPTAAQAGGYLTALATGLQGAPTAPRLTEPIAVRLTEPIAPATQVTSAAEQAGPAPTAADRQVVAQAESQPPRKGKGKLVGALVALLVVAGGGFAAVQALGGDDEEGEGPGTVAATDDAAAQTAAADEPADTEDAPSSTEPPESEAADETTAAETTTEDPTTTTTEAPAEMPDVVGKTLSQARTELRGVTVTVVEEFDAASSDNEVLEQSVAAGQDRPEEVELTVAKQPVTVYLADLESVARDDMEVETAELDGESYPRSIVSGYWGTSGYQEWNLSRGYRQLKATVGRSDDAGVSDETVQVEVFLDQRKVWSERVVLGEPIEMDVDVADALRLRIEYTSLNDEDGDLVLGDIHLLGLPGEVPEPDEDE